MASKSTTPQKASRKKAAAAKEPVETKSTSPAPELTVEEEPKEADKTGDGATPAETTKEEENTHEKLQQALGTRKGGKVWKDVKKPIRLNAVGVRSKSWEKKMQERVAQQAFKDRAKEMKEEKAAEKKVSLG